MARRKRRTARRRWPIVLLALAIAGGALVWFVAREQRPVRTDAPATAPVIAPNGPRETLDDADREALRDLLEQKRSR